MWKRIIERIELGHKRVLIRKGTGEGTHQFKKAAETYVHEVVCHLGEYLERRVDAYTPPVLPWE